MCLCLIFIYVKLFLLVFVDDIVVLVKLLGVFDFFEVMWVKVCLNLLYKFIFVDLIFWEWVVL